MKLPQHLNKPFIWPKRIARLHLLRPFLRDNNHLPGNIVSGVQERIGRKKRRKRYAIAPRDPKQGIAPPDRIKKPFRTSPVYARDPHIVPCFKRRTVVVFIKRPRGEREARGNRRISIPFLDLIFKITFLLYIHRYAPRMILLQVLDTIVYLSARQFMTQPKIGIIKAISKNTCLQFARQIDKMYIAQLRRTKSVGL